MSYESMNFDQAYEAAVESGTLTPLDPVIAYRSYYAGEKMYPAGRPARWTGRDRPAWLPA